MLIAVDCFVPARNGRSVAGCFAEIFRFARLRAGGAGFAVRLLDDLAICVHLQLERPQGRTTEAPQWPSGRRGEAQVRA